MPDKSITQIEPVILELLKERGPNKTICPSEAARRMAHLAGHPERWRAWLDITRTAGISMAKRGIIIMLQKGKRIDPDTARGAIRLRLP